MKLIPNISIDCVIFSYDERGLQVLLTQRDMNLVGIKEHKYDLKLPGGLVYNNELLKDAANRILNELTGLDGVSLEQFDVLDSLERMDQTDRLWLEKTSGLDIDRVISIAFFGIVKSEDLEKSQITENARWVDLKYTRKLPFDHTDIINRALLIVRDRMKRGGLVFNLLPEKFTINQLQNILEIFYNEELDSRNFRKKIKRIDYIVPLTEKQKNVAHKPARLFKFDKKRFVQVSKNRITT